MLSRDLVYLTQTDTTMGFVSKNPDRLNQIKQRLDGKHYIKALPSLRALKSHTRTPAMHKNRVRRANRATFIFPNTHSYRIIKDKEHLKLIDKLGWAYTTSANLSGGEFDESFALDAADVIVKYPSRGRSEGASKIFKINSSKIKRLR